MITSFVWLLLFLFFFFFVNFFQFRTDETEKNINKNRVLPEISPIILWPQFLVTEGDTLKRVVKGGTKSQFPA